MKTNAPTIECPLCSGTGKRASWHTGICPECDGSGQVIDCFSLAGPGSAETDQETAEAECRPLAEVEAETARAKKWIAKHAKKHT